MCSYPLRVLGQVKELKCSHYRPGVAQVVGRGIALLFHDRGIRRGWVVSTTHRPHFTSGKDPVLILQEAGWAPVPVWTDGKFRHHWDSIPDRPARSQSLYLLSYPVHVLGQVDLEYNHTSCELFLTKAAFTRRRIRKVTSVRGQCICFTPLMISFYLQKWKSWWRGRFRD